MKDSAKRSDGKAPGFWLYTADLERDFQILSLPAQGLAMRMLCWMHENESHRGFLELPNGVPLDESLIVSRIGKPTSQVRVALAELDRIGVFSMDARGCLYSRRMARDTHISTVRRDAANSRLAASRRAENGTFAGDFAPANSPANGEQKPSVTVTVSDTVTDSSLPLNSPQQNNALFDEQITSDSQGVVRSDVPAKTSEILIAEAAQRIYDRHPACRRCSVKEVITKLKAILRKLPRGERAAKLTAIEANHKACCSSEKWTEVGPNLGAGEFAKGLDNWLAPTMGRFDEAPPAPAVLGPRQVPNDIRRRNETAALIQMTRDVANAR